MSFFRNVFARDPKPERVDLTKRFDLLSRTGQGSMSEVWRARDSRTGRLVALKVLDRIKTEKLEQSFGELAEHKPSEGAISVALHHPHIVRTDEHGLSTDGQQYLVQEFLEGAGMTFLIDMQNATMRAERIRFMREFAEALEYVHEQGYLHRDLCPRNLMLDGENSLKLMDFGLAIPNTAEFLAPGHRHGTANYMAPELLRRSRVDHRIDLFSYSVTCYEMWSQQIPWDTPTAGSEGMKAMAARLNTPARDLRELVPDVPDAIAEIIMRGLEINPADRWHSMTEIRTALEAA